MRDYRRPCLPLMLPCCSCQLPAAWRGPAGSGGGGVPAAELTKRSSSFKELTNLVPRPLNPLGGAPKPGALVFQTLDVRLESGNPQHSNTGQSPQQTPHFSLVRPPLREAEARRQLQHTRKVGISTSPCLLRFQCGHLARAIAAARDVMHSETATCPFSLRFCPQLPASAPGQRRRGRQQGKILPGHFIALESSS